MTANYMGIRDWRLEMVNLQSPISSLRFLYSPVDAFFARHELLIDKRAAEPG